MSTSTSDTKRSEKAVDRFIKTTIQGDWTVHFENKKEHASVIHRSPPATACRLMAFSSESLFHDHNVHQNPKPLEYVLAPPEPAPLVANKQRDSKKTDACIQNFKISSIAETVEDIEGDEPPSSSSASEDRSTYPPPADEVVEIPSTVPSVPVRTSRRPSILQSYTDKMTLIHKLHAPPAKRLAGREALLQAKSSESAGPSTGRRKIVYCGVETKKPSNAIKKVSKLAAPAPPISAKRLTKHVKQTILEVKKDDDVELDEEDLVIVSTMNKLEQQLLPKRKLVSTKKDVVKKTVVSPVETGAKRNRIKTAKFEEYAQHISATR